MEVRQFNCCELLADRSVRTASTSTDWLPDAVTALVLPLLTSGADVPAAEEEDGSALAAAASWLPKILDMIEPKMLTASLLFSLVCVSLAAR
jgi:hypothetical protein